MIHCLDQYILRKPAFLSTLLLEYSGSDTFTLTAPFLYWSRIAGTQIVVPQGFVTDFASVPRIFRNIINTYGSHGYAAVIHDYLYKTGLFPRHICDRIFEEAMGASNVPDLKRAIIYRAVRLFGWRYYAHEEAAAGKLQTNLC